MSFVFLVAVIVGLLVLVAWPLFVRWRRPHRPTDQPTVHRGPVPPAHPVDEAPPGSAPHRHRQGKP